MNADELKNCPFCGGLAQLKDATRNPDRTGPYYWVKCLKLDCGVTTKAQDTIVRAINLWNTRATIEEEVHV